MLTIWGQKSRYCDGVSRRSFLKIGAFSFGAAVTKLRGPVDPSVPASAGLAAPTRHVPWSDPGRPGFLGAAYAPFKPDGPGLANLTLNGVTPERFADRRRLISSFDGMRR